MTLTPYAGNVMNASGFQEFIVKIASRCNLNCGYCYEYHLGDESWRHQPHFMAPATMEVLAKRIHEHCSSRPAQDIVVNFHGGEPLLAGPILLDKYCTILRNAIGHGRTLYIGIQTNATLLDASFIPVIRKHGLLVSVSIDGPASANDRHRLGHNGESSFEQAVAGIRLLKSLAPQQFTGMLAVVDLENDPLEVFDFLASFECENIDFLLPHYHWSRLPPRPEEDTVAYGRWYWRLYQAWVGDRHPNIQIRFFRNIVSQIAGGRAFMEAMTLEPCRLVTIAANGAIEGVDCLKATGSGIQQTGLHIATHSLDRVLESPLISARLSGSKQLSQACLECRHRNTCAGGYYPHRYSHENGFDNPSVYCQDLAWLLDRIRQHLSTLLSR